MARTPVSAIAQYAPLTIYVRGQVTFSRIASHIEGQELAKQNQEITAKRGIPHPKPYTTITIKNPVILDNGKLPALVKQVVQERFYTKQDGTLMFSQDSKSPFLPTVLYGPEAGELAGQGIADKDVPLQGELAVGLDITVGVSLFSKNGFAGLGMNYILVNEPIRYYTNVGLASDLAAAGITYTAPVRTDVQPPQAAAPTAFNTPAPAAFSTPVAPAFNTPVPSVPTAPEQVVMNPTTFQPSVDATTAYSTDPMFSPGTPASPMPSGFAQEPTQVQRPTRYY